MNNNTVQEVIENVKEFAKKQSYSKGWYAGNGEDFWVKCDSFEVSEALNTKYIIFVNQRATETVFYKA